MEQVKPRVSVIVPTLNSAAYLEECLQSALAQTLREIEILCVDAGSTDGTLEILDRFAKLDSRVRVLHSERRSYGYQMNLGMDAAVGEYLAILESDDIIRPNMYAALTERADRDALDFVKADYEIFVGEGKKRTFTYMNTCRRGRDYNRIINPQKEIDSFNARMNTWTGIYRLSFLRANGIRHNETPGASYQDNGFWFQTFLFANRILFVNSAWYCLRRDNPNSSVHQKDKVYCIFEEYAFIERILRKDAKKEAAFIGIFHKKKFDNCSFHYTRVGGEYKLEFLARMSDEFRVAREKGELKPELFYGSGYATLQAIIDDPVIYGLLNGAEIPESAEPALKLALLEKQKELALRQLNEVEASLPYRIGCAFLWLPRKIKGGITCVKDNGWAYTLRHLRNKIFRH